MAVSTETTSAAGSALGAAAIACRKEGTSHADAAAHAPRLAAKARSTASTSGGGQSTMSSARSLWPLAEVRSAAETSDVPSSCVHSKSVCSSRRRSSWPAGDMTAGDDACTRSSMSTSRARAILPRSCHRVERIGKRAPPSPSAPSSTSASSPASADGAASITISGLGARTEACGARIEMIAAPSDSLTSLGGFRSVETAGGLAGWSARRFALERPPLSCQKWW
mmetsp:Transcript_26855/g.62715  ORF Transcript_26855/g.62715 Transcript_26855/m.62715 type:complete len:224 (+) Transcript_26855:290-961(+)